MAGYNGYVKRASAILRGGKNISDIAVLYPIADLYANHKFGEGDPYLGGNTADYVNYTKIGETLSLDIRKDFIYVHPETLDKIIGDYKIVIVPAMETIHVKNLETLNKFVLEGGTVIFAGRAPSKSAEPGQNDKVRELLTGMSGGKCFYMPDLEYLSEFLNKCGVIFDVDIGPADVSGGNFTYIHKVLDGRDIYFFANSSDTPVSAKVKLRGEKSLEAWDPHTGDKKAAAAEYNNGATALTVELEAVKSMFFVTK